MALHRIQRSYRGGAGITGIDLGIRAGEVHALVGLNGAGKSTLMKVLLGMLRPDAGTVTIAGVDIRTAGQSVWARVGHVVESPLAYAEFTVRENLMINARLRGIAKADRPATVSAAITDFHLEGFERNRARTLSSGNRQRVGLAAALQHHPRFIVLDEPTTALDPAGTILLRDRIRRCAQQGAAILISSHHLDEVARVADRITVMNAGRLIGQLDPGGRDLEHEFFAFVLRDDEAHHPANGRTR